MFIINKYKIAVGSIVLALLLVVFPSMSINAESAFSPDDNGVYHITSLDDWNAFFDKMGAGEMFSQTEIVMDSDLTITGTSHGFCLFSGIINGNGHTISYSCDDLYADNAVVPVWLFNGTIKNLDIILDNCSVDAGKHSGNVTVSALTTNSIGGTVENVKMSGKIEVVPSPSSATTIVCSGIAPDGCAVKDSIVNINYEIDKEKMDQFLLNSEDNQLRIKLFQFGYSQFVGDPTTFSKCIAIGDYSSYFKENGSTFEAYYENKLHNMDDEYVLVAAFGGNKGDISPTSIEDCYYDTEVSPLCLYGDANGKNNAKSYYFNDDSMLKSTEDLKKQETFVDYDFENVWGISEYINEGYPYLRALVSKDLVDLVDQIAALPKDEALTKEDKETVDKLKELLEGLSDKDQALIDAAALSDKVDKAEKAIEALDNKDKADDSTQEQETSTKKDSATTPAATKIALKKGTKFTVKGYKFKVTGVSIKNPTASVTGYKNKKLKKITVPATVTYKKVKFRVTAVANNAFKNQKKAKSVVIGKNVTAIGKAAFFGDAKVKKITVKSVSLKNVGAKAFKGIHKKAVIKVPAKKLSAYKKMMKKKGQAKTVKIK